MPHRRFLKNLKLVAVDELHYYHGTFGRYDIPCFEFGISHPDPTSHVAQVMRRLRRVGAAVGSEVVLYIRNPTVSSRPRCLQIDESDLYRVAQP